MTQAGLSPEWKVVSRATLALLDAHHKAREAHDAVRSMQADLLQEGRKEAYLDRTQELLQAACENCDSARNYLNRVEIMAAEGTLG